ncbi:hypothetical protein ACVWZV_002409 [Bradyrhizobium sp. GM5.1]
MAFVEVLHHDDGAEIGPRGAGDYGARQRLQLRLDGFFDIGGKARGIGNQDRLRAGIVLSLGQQVGGNPVGIAGVIGDDEHLGGTRDHVDADLAEDQPLCRGDICIAGADDLGDGRDRRGAMGERGHRLRTADAIDLGDATKLCRRQHQRIELAVGRGHHHDETRHAGDLCRHRIHQHRGRIGRGAAGHVEAGGFDRGVAPAELDAELIGEALVLRQLAAVIGLDAIARELERIQRRCITGFHRGLDLGGGDAQVGCIERQPVELCRGLEQGGIAPLRHVVDDGTRGRLDIGRGLALGGEEGPESLVKIGAAAVETNGHLGF